MRVKFWEEKLHLNPGSLVRIGSVRGVSSIGKTKLATDGFGIGVSGLENFRGAHQCPPFLRETEVLFQSNIVVLHELLFWHFIRATAITYED